MADTMLRMTNPLVQKLRRFTRLSSSDEEALDAATRSNVSSLGAREDIIGEGDAPAHVNLILSGWACRYKQLADGRRQITAFFVPGDLCDLRIFILKAMDHSIGTLTPVTFARLSRDAILELSDAHPRLSRALWWSGLVSEAIEREWIVNLGQRRATERCAHLMCELYLRLETVGLVNGQAFEWPLTQTELGEAAGLSTVHINRTLQELRASQLIELRGKTLRILDFERLKAAASFSSNYLHLGHEGQQFDANDF